MKQGNTIKRLLAKMTGKYRLSLVFVFFFILLSAVAGIAGSFFMQRLVDDFILPLSAADDPDFGGLLVALAIMGSIYGAGVLSTFIYNRMMVDVSQGTLKKIRDEMFSHMQSLPVSYYDSHTHGDLMSRYTNDADTLREMLSMTLPGLLSGVFSVSAVTVSMLILNVPLSIFVFVCVAVMVVVAGKVAGSASRHFKQQQKAIGSLNGFVAEMFNGQKVVKVFCHEEEAQAEFDRRNQVLRRHVSTANTLTSILMPVLMNIGNLQYVLIALIGGAFAINGAAGMTLGTIAAFLTLSKAFSAPIGQMSSQVNIITTALAGAERIFNLLDEPPEPDDGHVTLVNAKYINGSLAECEEHTGLWAWKSPREDGSAAYTETEGHVTLSGVDFSYIEDKPVLHDVTIHAEPGQKIAFVGATGAGKTTITNLINRFYDIDDGEILFDGINIREIKKSGLRRALGIVLQDTHLFTGTVADNIRYGNLDATDEEVRRAAELANAHDFITRLPDGYDTLITGDGGSLSGGQRQLLAIARAAVANPPVMILDEATSSIDTRTEAIVQQGMDSLMNGRTVFVIAHRLSTVRNSDAIMVMEGGRIVERGSHETLIADGGRYYQLYTGAFANQSITV